MLITSLFLLLPAFAQAWQCGIRYDETSSSVIPWADLLPPGVGDLSQCTISSPQPTSIKNIGFAAFSFCFGMCNTDGEICLPTNASDVTETATITCDIQGQSFTRQYSMTRVGGCACAQPSGGGGEQPGPPACYARTKLGSPSQLSLYLHFCESTSNIPVTYDECVDVSCSGGTPECLPDSPVQNTASFTCPSISQESTCTGGTLSIACPADTVIQIVEAIYGAWEYYLTCPDQGTGNADPDCQNAMETTPIVQGLCNGMQSCFIIVANDGSLGTDLCPAVNKHLRVEHFCTPVLTAVGCEDGPISASCPGGLHIDVTKATFGRPYAEASCPPGGSGEPVSPCSTDVTAEVDTLCAGQSTCSTTVDFINAGNPGFVDPCPGVDSFLKMEYICTPLVLWWTIDTTITAPATISADKEYDTFDTCSCQ